MRGRKCRIGPGQGVGLNEPAAHCVHPGPRGTQPHHAAVPGNEPTPGRPQSFKPRPEPSLPRVCLRAGWTGAMDRAPDSWDLLAGTVTGSAVHFS